MKVKHISAYRLEIPLTRPYHLSFGAVQSFSMVVAQVWTDRGRYGLGETTAAPGYSHESLDEIWSFTKTWAPKLIGLDLDDALALLMPRCELTPYSVAPLANGIEMMQFAPVTDSLENGFSLPILGTINGMDPDTISREVADYLERGFKTLKMKVGWDVKDDIERTRFIQRLIGENALLRIDANQGYDFQAGLTFVQQISPQNVELFEQPFKIDRWDEMKRLSEISPIPLMLDESIRYESDLEKTIALGCAHYVKFKLLKAGSMTRLMALMRKASKSGLKVVLGNGMGGEIGCCYEAVLGRWYLDNAGEMNGLMKQTDFLFCPAPLVEDGDLVFPPDYLTRMDSQKRDAVKVAEEQF